MSLTDRETELLGHLTRRLGSDHEGEAEAARERIIQLLDRHNLNFNDYAEWLQAGSSASDGTDLRQENAALRNEVLGLHQEVASLRAALMEQLGPEAGRLALDAVRAPGFAEPIRAPRDPTRIRRRLRHQLVLFALVTIVPAIWLLTRPHPAALRPPPASGRPTVETPLSSAEDTGAQGWRPPPGSRPAVVLENGVVLTAPYASRATEQAISRGARVAILRQLVANGRQWAEIASPAANGYIPIDQLETIE
ncbi:hypothetical protein [Muricoccus vinaceus]|uniref:SH3 domain-containing protein n=1 Tax=Muricoccus vinaceus TaxID=424704 RepID=A0ABV6J1J9_9PROT